MRGREPTENLELEAPFPNEGMKIVRIDTMGWIGLLLRTSFYYFI
jgi:hypothetical protein